MKPLGILMLDTRFPRIVGDIGNPGSFDYPVIFRRMIGIGSKDAVAAHPDRPRMLAALKENAEALAAEGAVGLSTSCGFLALYQKDLERLSPIPVATSALLHIRKLTGRKVGVITASATNLTAAHLAAVDAPVDTPVVDLYIVRGRSIDLVHQLEREITEGVVRALGVTRERVRVLVHEVPGDHWAIGGLPATVRRAADEVERLALQRD